MTADHLRGDHGSLLTRRARTAGAAAGRGAPGGRRGGGLHVIVPGPSRDSRGRPAGTQPTWMSLAKSWADESWTARRGRCSLSPSRAWAPGISGHRSGTHHRSVARPRSRARPARPIPLSSGMSGPATTSTLGHAADLRSGDLTRQLPARTRPGAALIWPGRGRCGRAQVTMVRRGETGPTGMMAVLLTASWGAGHLMRAEPPGG
jgi:hypothetical protein